MVLNKDYLIVCSMVLVATCQTSTLKKNIHEQWEGSTSPTISVQRYGGSTYYKYLRADPPTTVASSFSGEETQSPSGSSSATKRASSYQYSESGSGSVLEDVEIEEERLSGGNEDDVQVVETTVRPTDDEDDVGEDEKRTEKSPVSSISDSSGDAAGPEAVPPAGDTVDSPDGGNGGPSDQKPELPAEAVPGQPGEDDPDSSSSSSEESSSSSSSEEFRQTYKQKVWEHSKVKSSKDSLLLARLHNKLVGKKDKANKYAF